MVDFNEELIIKQLQQLDANDSDTIYDILSSFNNSLFMSTNHNEVSVKILIKQ